ncbi:segregation/condensation protein A [Aliterella atlantica]|uniref:Segregation and condensation protein A n=1 Tax=Aliterella atlantica CENA595 TaxID=1618023 RepID=A0A0D8ZSY5_9CYAN|nr:segregation/condensation protein A [Aliterella atlantica]KJH71850.1 hypothetical protein UH38_10760 [Aliterella atlantica CENA595]
MDAAKLFESIALLIDLAQKGEIDPWDVQVIEVFDRYLVKLFADRQTTASAYEADLSQSGQAFLLASMLVLFKANTLSNLELNPQEPVEDELALLEQGSIGMKPRLHLEQQLRRRPAALPPQKRAVTLQELIDQLRLMATQIQASEHGDRPTAKRSLRPVSRAQITRTTLELAHQENLTEVAGKLAQFLSSYAQGRREQQQTWLNLEQLVELWSHAMPSHTIHKQPADLATPHPIQGDRVGVFWALLLLSAQSKVELSQEEFYQELKIRTLEESAIGELQDAS